MLLLVIALGIAVIGGAALLKMNGQREADVEADRKAGKKIVPVYKRRPSADVGGAGLFLWSGSSDGGGFSGGSDGHHGGFGGFDGGSCGDGGSGGGDSGGC